MASHHATLLFLPWLALAVLLHLLFNRQVQWKTLIVRLFILGILSTLAILLVIWPFWDWGRVQTIQTPIDHASRHNFFKDPLAALIFFLPIYGPLMILIPFVIWLAGQQQLIGLGISFFMLFLLGLGGTTPLPRWFFGAGWEWLTYDRFAFWASLALLPFFGIIVILLRRKYSKDISGRIFSILAITSIIVGLVTTLLPLQPGPVDMSQIVDFLEEEEHARWRYVTFGFGDQLALLSTLTTATTIDGSYHTARTLPELRASGIGQIDTAFWLKSGLSRLDSILQKAGDHGVRWGFVNVPQYVPVLKKNGWKMLTTLKGGVQVWENLQAITPQPSQPPVINPLASFSWGTLPLLSLITSLALGSLRIWPLQAEKALRGIYAFLVGLIPVGLCFWYYRTLGEFSHARVYFTYDHALFFLSDALVLLAVILWITTKFAQPLITNYNVRFPPGQRSFLLLLIALFLLSSLSILWSSDWRISFYISLHFWLIFLLILSIRDRPDVWKPVMFGFCIALMIQVIAGFIGFASQSTAFVAPLDAVWPGLLDPSTRAASVVELPNGLRILRAYGTLPHPNILGGFVLISLLGPAGLFLINKKPGYLALLVFIPGIALLAITFSRAAWLALIAFSLVLIWKSKYFDRKRLAILLMLSALSFTLTLFPYRDLVAARTINTTSHSEEFSFIGRAWLSQEATKMIREQPLAGAGIGSFILRLAQHAGAGYVIEPVHNIFLLAGAELGIPGLLLMTALAISFAYRLSTAQNPNAILAGATITGLGVIGLFDHYLWTLAPGRLMLGLMLGLWAGQTIHNDD